MLITTKRLTHADAKLAAQCSNDLPIFWPKGAPFRYIAVRASCVIAALYFRQYHVSRVEMVMTYLLVHFRTPPLEALHPTGEHDTKEDDYNAKCKPRIQGSTEHHVVLSPPILPAVANLVVEDVAHDRPDGEVQASGRWNPTQTAEDDGKVDLAEDGLAVVARKVPQHNWRDGTDEEGPHEWSVECARAEETLWSYNTPEDTAIEVDPRDGAVEAVDGFGGADAGDVVEHPVQNPDLSQT